MNPYEPNRAMLDKTGNRIADAINNLAESMGGGSSGGGGALMLNETYTESEEGQRTYRLDKTFAEIYEAVKAGKYVVLRYNMLSHGGTSSAIRYLPMTELLWDDPGSVNQEPYEVVFNIQISYRALNDYDYPVLASGK